MRPAAEIHVDEHLVRRLLEEQHPAHAADSLARVDEGWDNFTYRLGPKHAVRLPRREAAVQPLLNEQRWLPQVASWLPVSVPVPIRLGVPSDLFPWPWSIVEWVDGTTVDQAPLRPDQAGSLARALRALHRTPPEEAPVSPFRGVPLVSRRGVVEERLERLGLRELSLVWHRALEAAPASTRSWIHGDLHPRNVLVDRETLSGIIDWGDLTAGDVATDLSCAWTLFDAPGRAEFWEAYGPSDAERTRALAWAVNLASALVGSGDRRHESIGWSIVERVVRSD